MRWNILLADDDLDDCIFFLDALEDIDVSANLITVNDGIQLMQLLTNTDQPLPHVLFLDLNMPRKNGFDCLSEIKTHHQLKELPVIIFSTSLDADVVNQVIQSGATLYVRKPAEFSNLKKVIQKSLKLISDGQSTLLLDNFVVTP